MIEIFEIMQRNAICSKTFATNVLPVTFEISPYFFDFQKDKINHLDFFIETLYFWDIQRRWFNLKNEILMGKNKKAAYSKREEEKANRIVKGLFIGLIVLALVIMVGYAMYG
ncbi:hypothetical protein J8857_03590 [Phocaeicola dorei]|nr:hypothetical protein [Phocaeicola dorei]MCE8448237.1 hypothetical protein [Phocaeicola dorei]